MALSQNDHSLTEPSLLDSFEIEPHTIGEEPLSAADNNWANNHLELVDKTCIDRSRGELKTCNSYVARGICLEPPERVGIECALDLRPCANVKQLVQENC